MTRLKAYDANSLKKRRFRERTRTALGSRTELIFRKEKSTLSGVTDFIVDGNERGFLFEKPISEHLAINSKMKVTHRRLYVRNTKNRLERKFERFSHI